MIHEQEDIKELKMKIMEFFKNNPTPDDSKIHAFSDQAGMNPHEFEEVIYNILGTFFGAGKAKNFTGSYDPKQIAMGIEVEMEHTSCKLIAERIAKDHLAEFPDYYTRLDKMEKEAEKEFGE